MGIFLDVLGALAEAGLDTLKLLPFLLAVHILIEWFEHSAASRMRFSKMLNGWYAPAAAGALGLVPQCGFSVVATKLFSKKNIRLGTLLAVYIATSDEAIPILISNPDAWGKILPLIGIKFVFAIAAGYLVNAAIGFKGRGAENRGREPEAGGQGTDTECVETVGCHGHVLKNAEYKTQNAEVEDNHYHHEPSARVAEDGAHYGDGHNPTHRKTQITNHEPRITNRESQTALQKVWGFLKHPVSHTLTIGAFILAVNIAFGLLFAFIGEDAVFNFMDSAAAAQPFISGLVGLIPNCGASVVITQAYARGGLSLGAAVSGLSVSAGVAYAVLFKENKHLAQNLLIVGGLYVVSCILGLAITLLGFVG